MTLSPAPKPAPREKKPRKPLRAKQWGVSSNPRKKIPKINLKKAQKRAKLTRDFHATPEFIAAGETAMVRAGNRCEFVAEPGTILNEWTFPMRCTATEKLERHCKWYPKTRPIEAKDIQILCDLHHDYVEMVDHPERAARRRAIAQQLKWAS